MIQTCAKHYIVMYHKCGCREAVHNLPRNLTKLVNKEVNYATGSAREGEVRGCLS
jgi:hypothetical protein